MSDTWWGSRGPGEPSIRENEDGSAEMMLPVGGPPDWVRLPPELGGIRVRVAQVENTPCPCGTGHLSPRYVLAHRHEDRQLYVSECMEKGFLWHTLKDKE